MIVVLAVNNQPVRGMRDVDQVLRGRTPGEQVEFQIERQGQTQSIPVALGVRSPYVDIDTSLSLRKPELRVRDRPREGGRSGYPRADHRLDV